ncbi:hypothetical protein C0989_001801 [Termitomyces sp. Mn162]|nr:hypothetical protein C0989_001801 [Termitomyces sp. Mn162]
MSKMVLSDNGMEWAKLVTVDKECQQLYEHYKEEEWICLFDKYFVPLPPSLEFLMEDLAAGMRALTVVDTGMGAGVVLEKVKGKSTVLLEKQHTFKQERGAVRHATTAGLRTTQKAAGTQQGPSLATIATT